MTPPPPEASLKPGASLVDTHAHLTDGRLHSRLNEVLSHCVENEVLQIVAVATTAADTLETLAVARSHPGIYASAGIHPNEAAEAQANDWDRVAEVARLPEVVALGETGLDRHWDRTPFPLQQDYFARHLSLAHELDKPVIIHSRDCHADVIEQLRQLGRPIKGVLHSFTGSLDEAQAFLDLGLHISFAGMITFANKALDPLRDVSAAIPIDRLLVETDSPYLTPHPFRGKTNEPARVVYTAAKLAEVRGMLLPKLAAATTQNAQRLFNLPSDRLLTNT